MGKYENELNALIGREIFQVVVGEYQVQFNCDSNFSICAEKTMRMITKEGETLCDASKPDSLKGLITLSGKSIKGAQVLDDKSFQLVFSDDIKLIIDFVDDGYESYQINLSGNLIVF